MNCSALKSEKGESIMGLMVSMAIGVSVLGVLTSTFLMQQGTYNVQRQTMEAVQTARAAKDMMSREIRMAGYDPTRAGFTGITYDSTRLRLRADLDGDGNITATDEDITYEYYGEANQIRRKTHSGTYEVLAENIAAFTFTYLDSTLSPTTTTADIRAVKIAITARTERPDADYPNNNGHRTMTLTGCTVPPNLGFP